MYCVHQTPAFSSNGYAIRTKGVAAALDAAGWDVTVVARSGYPWDYHVDLPRQRVCRAVEGIDYVHLPGGGLGDTPPDQAIDEATDAFVREARRLRPAVIHAASDWHTGLAALRAARVCGVPFVYEVRGLWELTELSAKPGWDATERYALQVALETQVARAADGVLAITSQVAGVLADRGVDHSLMRVAPNCVDPLEFLPLPPDPVYAQRQGIDLSRPVVGYAGSLVGYEGLDVLLDAIALLRQRGVEVTVAIAGSGPAEPELKAEAARLGVEDAVRWLGRIPHADVPRLWSAVDVAVFPRRSEPVTELVSPLKPLEAFAAGRAVIVSDVQPQLDLAGAAQERAAAFAAGDSESLAAVLGDLLGDPERRAGLGRHARLWVGGERSWQRVGAVFADAYAAARRHHAVVQAAARPLADCRIGLIADEFTVRAVQGSLGLVLLSREGWRDQLDGLDAVIVESAWEGNAGQWRRGVGRYSEAEHKDLCDLLAACRDQGIPTVFWSKEDPVHFDRFVSTAVLCDVVLTVDANRLGAYRQVAGPTTRWIGSLPFFAQRACQHPLGDGTADDEAVAYAGTYYGDRFKERTAVLRPLLDAVQPTGLALYDRQWGQAESPYHFPAEYRDCIRGRVAAADMPAVYRSHLAHISVNSVTDSPTMFARRLVEIPACGGIVVSGPGRALSECLGGIVPSWPADRLAAAVAKWRCDPAARRAEQWHQFRGVARAHLADGALTLMLRAAGLPVAPPVLPTYGVI
jgi:glycosyltransferase involved in cell wall biosynthesis